MFCLLIIIALLLETCSFTLENGTNIKNKTAPTWREEERGGGLEIRASKGVNLARFIIG
jgi:outer membrane biogenesis lipoprotein LolB